MKRKHSESEKKGYRSDPELVGPIQLSDAWAGSLPGLDHIVAMSDIPKNRRGAVRRPVRFRVRKSSMQGFAAAPASLSATYLRLEKDHPLCAFEPVFG